MISIMYEFPRNKATALRDALDLEQPWLDVVGLMEFMIHQILPGFWYEVVGKNELPDSHALAFPRQQRLVIREDVYNGACNNNTADRFTLAHELGHIFLHKGIRARQDERSAQEWIDDLEVEANVFGMELMMPAPIALQVRTPAILGQLCGVSRSIAIYQWSAVRSAAYTGKEWNR